MCLGQKPQHIINVEENVLFTSKSNDSLKPIKLKKQTMKGVCVLKNGEKINRTKNCREQLYHKKINLVSKHDKGFDNSSFYCTM